MMNQSCKPLAPGSLCYPEQICEMTFRLQRHLETKAQSYGSAFNGERKPMVIAVRQKEAMNLKERAPCGEKFWMDEWLYRWTEVRGIKKL